MAKTLILGGARSGKDTLAKMMGFKYQSSSEAALDLFLFPILNDARHEMGFKEYRSLSEAFEDRVNHRDLWKTLIEEFNSKDRTRLATHMLADSDVYVGMRSNLEYQACMKKALFDHVIWVTAFDRVEPEPTSSFDIEFDASIMSLVLNNGTEEELAEIAKSIKRDIQSNSMQMLYAKRIRGV